MGKVPTISINKTDGCHAYLSKNSLDCEIVSAKSSEMNVLIPTEGGDFVSFLPFLSFLPQCLLYPRLAWSSLVILLPLPPKC
jgi:hypothetical protein